MPRKLLVTGGAGFIGANFARYWLQHHPRDTIVVLDALTYAGNLQNLAPWREHSGLQFVHGDICDSELVVALLRRHALCTVVNFAAESHVDRSILQPSEFVRTNVVGTQVLLEACRRVWLGESRQVHRFHQISTDEVYGPLLPHTPAHTEASAYQPSSPYAASKAAADCLVRAYHRTYGMHTTISMSGNNYGPRQFPEKLIPLMILNILEGRKLPIYGDGGHVREWLHVEDHCRGIAQVLEYGAPGEIYHLGGGWQSTNLSLVQQLCAISDEMLSTHAELRARFPRAPIHHGATADSLLSFVCDRPGHDRRYALCADKAVARLGYAPRVTLPGGLRATIEWYARNEVWWRRLLNDDYEAWLARQYGEQDVDRGGHVEVRGTGCVTAAGP